jgi:hypothetical protein
MRSPGEPPYNAATRRHEVEEADRVEGAELNDHADLGAVFSEIFRTNQWGSEETLSGEGSERSKMKNLIDEFHHLMRDLDVKSVLDAPCGDFNWMQDVNLDKIEYLGCDIVADLISANAGRYGNEGKRSFQMLDFTAQSVPRTDLILCRDALVHLPDRYVFKALKNFCASGSKYLLTTTFPETRENGPIQAGWWRPINLQNSPFNLPRPTRWLSDADSDDKHPDKILALWDLKELKVSPG